MDKQAIAFTWVPTAKIAQIQELISNALVANPEPLQEGDVVAALFFLILGTLMMRTMDEQTRIAGATFLELISDVFEQTGCHHQVHAGQENPETKH